MRFGSLKAKYRKEYGDLRAERQGQQELLCLLSAGRARAW
jgi:hypothetical protein